MSAIFVPTVRMTRSPMHHKPTHTEPVPKSNSHIGVWPGCRTFISLYSDISATTGAIALLKTIGLIKAEELCPEIFSGGAKTRFGDVAMLEFSYPFKGVSLPNGWGSVVRFSGSWVAFREGMLIRWSLT